MKIKPLLVLESPWYRVPTLSTRRLYARFTQGQMRPFIPRQDLTLISRFAQTAGILVLSGHGEFEHGQRLLLTQQGYVDIQTYLQQVSAPLSQTSLILDACYIGKQPETLRQSLGLKAVLGFSKQVNWQASSVFILALLKRWQYAEFYQHSDISLLQQMATGEYLHLMQQLGVVWAYNTLTN